MHYIIYAYNSFFLSLVRKLLENDLSFSMFNAVLLLCFNTQLNKADTSPEDSKMRKNRYPKGII